MFRILFSCLRARACLALAAGLFAGAAGARAASDYDGFDPQADGNVYAVALQADGKVLLGGSFQNLRPNGAGTSVARAHLARLNPDGTVDPAFAAVCDGDVTALALQSDGRILVGGRFTSVSSGGVTQSRNGLARLNADGSIDTAFDARLTGPGFPLGLVRTLAVQPDDRILLGGSFTGAQPGGSAAPVVRNRILRLNADGTLDTGFDPNANNVVLALAVQRDGRILLGGGFTALQPNGAGTATERQRLARLNADGTLDATFDPQPDNRVAALALQADGSILVGGDFQTFRPAGASFSTTRPFAARLTPAGALDSTFYPSPGAAVEMVAVQFDGGILLGGRFGNVRPFGATSPTNVRYLARFHPDGTLDDAFRPNPTAQVAAVAQQSDGRLVVGGYFTAIRPASSGSSAARNFIARLQPDGAADAPLNLAVTGGVSLAVRQPDGKLLVGGSFSSVAGVTRSNLARLNADGTLDRDFAPEIDGPVTNIVVQDDGRILVAGSFSSVDGTARSLFARLQADGSLDTVFDPRPNGAVTTIYVQSDGHLVIGGGFTSLQPNGAATATTRNRLARLNADGTLDASFDPNADGLVSVIIPEADGRLLVGGAFTALQPNGAKNATAHGGIVRLNADGSLAADFTATTNGAVQAIVLQSDGRYVIGGSFTQVISTGGRTAILRNRLARMSADGTFDPVFDPSPNSTVTGLRLLSGGRLLVSGFFNNFSAAGSPAADTPDNPVVTRSFLAIVSGNSGVVDESFDLRPNAVVNSMVVEPAGTVLLAGTFSSFSSGDSVIDVPDHLARINPDTNAIDPGFRPQLAGVGDDRIGAVAIDADGNLLVGGSFSDLGGSTRTNLMRLFNDGVRDVNFSASTDGEVRALAVLPDPDDVAAGPNKFAWLNSNGTLRSTFSHATSESLIGTVRAAVVQSDGKLVVGGDFFINGGGVGPNLVRFNTDGTLDTSFSPGPGSAVSSLALLADGRLLVGGAFTSIGGSADLGFLARLNPDGTPDTSFRPKPNSSVIALAVQADGKVLAGGTFTTFQPNGATATTSRSYLARINADGTLDTSFVPALNSTVYDIKLQSDGQVLVGGAFSTVNSTTRNNLVRLQASGSLDTTFDPEPSGVVHAIAVQPDNRILLGGEFTSLQPNGAESATARFFLARVESNGTLDTSFDPSPNGSVLALGLQSDGDVVIGGMFSSLTPNGAGDFTVRSRVARVNADGTLDPGFNPIADGVVNTVVIPTDGSIVIGGNFTSLSPDPTLLVAGDFSTISSAPFPYLARLNSDGSADAAFQPAPDAAVFALATTTSGEVYVGGAFASLGGLPRTRLARLAPDGTVDGDFAPAVDGTVHTVAVQPDGGVILGGEFATVGGGAHARIARVLADGSVDAAFAASANGTVEAVAVQPDGRILLAGEFTTVNGTGRNRLARLNADGTLDGSFNPGADGTVWSLALQADGRILAGGAFTTIAGVIQPHLARLDASGALDATMDASVDGPVLTIVLQPDGRPMIAGEFANVDGRTSYLLGRVAASAPATQALSMTSDRTSLTWTRGGTGVDFQAVQFSVSTDGDTWTDLGPAVRTGAPGVWQWSGTALPANTNYFVRARGERPATRYGSLSRAEVVWQFYNTTLSGWAAYFAGGHSAAIGSPAGTHGGGAPSTGNDSGGGSGADDGSAGGSGGGGGGNPTDPDGSNAPRDTVPGLVNFSTRAEPVEGIPLITGFVISGSEPQRVLLRAVGPGLAVHDVTGTMRAPWIQLYDRDRNVVEESAAWGGEATLADAFAATGAFPLDPADADSALLVELAPGAYTMHVRDSAGGTGIVLNEIYVVDGNDPAHTRGLANLSTRGPVGQGASVLIGGFVVGGTTPRQVVVRGIGPGLRRYGVDDAVADPRLQIYDVDGNPIAANDNWQTQDSGISAAAIVSAFNATGAFALENGSKDAAIVITLPPGVYTAHVSSATTGSALVETYEVP